MNIRIGFFIINQKISEILSFLGSSLKLETNRF